MSRYVSREEREGYFLDWFRANGGTIDESAIAIKHFKESEGGRGIVALKDIPSGHKIFTIPRTLMFSTRTSALPNLFGMEDWEQWKLDKGWTGLILCMLWEEAQEKSHWAPYNDLLPTYFDTPMFFNSFELRQLHGTSITLIGKIGKEQMERDFKDIIVPAIKSRPDLFPRDILREKYSLKRYHIMGSRLMSRSFTVEPYDGSEAGGSSSGHLRSASPKSEASNSMDVDKAQLTVPAADRRHEVYYDYETDEDAHVEENDDDDSDDEDNGEEQANICMVPMADMLNARYKCENAKVFYEPESLSMITTKDVKAGEQVLNSYGNLSNAELLRRYGYVDLLPLGDGRVGNPGDTLEIPADLIQKVVAKGQIEMGQAEGVNWDERIEWWLDEGGDDYFEVGGDLVFHDDMIIFMRIMMMSEPDWQAFLESFKRKGKHPKAKYDELLVEYLSDVLDKRQWLYPLNLGWDENMIIQHDEGTMNGTNKWKLAVYVRIGEQRLVDGLRQKVQAMKDKLAEDKREAKRKALEAANGRENKRQRI